MATGSTVSPLGLRMDDTTVRVAVGLRLGSPLCRPHTCHHCGAEVDHLATHGLSCRWSEGRHFRLSALNDIVHRALSSAKVPSRLEPAGIYRSDGKRPDGITVVPWERKTAGLGCHLFRHFRSIVLLQCG